MPGISQPLFGTGTVKSSSFKNKFSYAVLPVTLTDLFFLQLALPGHTIKK
jgi:hypothetical protein